MQYYQAQQFRRLMLISICFICMIKILFVGYDIDEQYAISMSYRMLTGDFPLLDMWEPHQTSGFLTALFMLPYIAVTGSVTGIVLYLRACGLLCHICVTYFLYRALRRELNQSDSLLICGIFVMSLPKFMLLPEFSNMYLWFLTLCVLCLLRYYQTGKLLYLIWSGFFLSFEILAYPSTVFSFFACLFCMIHFHCKSLQSNTFGILRAHKTAASACVSQKRLLLRELFSFTLPCAFCAAVFFGALLSHMTISSLWEQLRFISSDGSHSASLVEKFDVHLLSLLEIFFFLGIYSAFATLFYFIIRNVRMCRSIPFLWGRLLFVCSLLGQIGIWLFGNQYPGYPMLEYPLISLTAIILVIMKKTSPIPIFTLFIIISPVAFLGILLFSNHPLIVSLPYLAPCAVGVLALLGQKHRFNSTAKQTNLLCRVLSYRGIITLWLLVLVFGRCYMLRTTGGIHYTMTDKISLMREGPAIGVIADTETVRHYRINYEFIKENLPANARVFYAGASSQLYLMKDMEICTPSTISTPTFNNTVTAYFDRHPDKLPQYLICETSLNDLYIDSWLSHFIDRYCSSMPVAANDFLLVYTIAYIP